MDFIFEAFQFLADAINEIIDFFTTLPLLIRDCFNYAFYWFISLYISIQIFGVEMAKDIASLLLSDYEVYTVLNNAFNGLPSGLRSACYQFGIVDSVRIIVDAYATAFVLRIMGW